MRDLTKFAPRPVPGLSAEYRSQLFERAVRRWAALALTEMSRLGVELELPSLDDAAVGDVAALRDVVSRVKQATSRLPSLTLMKLRAAGCTETLGALATVCLYGPALHGTPAATWLQRAAEQVRRFAPADVAAALVAEAYKPLGDVETPSLDIAVARALAAAEQLEQP